MRALSPLFAPIRETWDDRPVTARFLTVGEALTDIVVETDGTRTEHPGGSPLNVAIALGRLGHESLLLTRIGEDARGAEIAAHLERSRVELVPGSVGPEPTSTAEAVLDATGAAAYAFDLSWDPHPAQEPAGFRALHTSSIAAVLEPGARLIRELVARARATATISYDPNARPSLMGDAARSRALIEEMIAQADVVKASDEDVEWLYGSEDVEDVVASWRELGPSLTVLTRGGSGSVGFAAGGRVQVAPQKVSVVDTVGAGDTFSAGILDALAHRDLLGADRREQLRALPADDLAAILRRASALAAVTVSRAGANPPWAHELR